MKKKQSLLFLATNLIMIGGIVLAACSPAATATTAPTTVPDTAVPAPTPTS